MSRRHIPHRRATVTHDLTKGPIAGHFRTLAIPAALGMLFNTLYNVVDIYFAGLLSTDGQAGMALGFQAFYIVLAAGIGLGTAMGALVGNALGRKDDRTARRVASQGFSFGVIACALLVASGAWFGPAVIALVSEPGTYRDAGVSYYLWLMIALPGFLLAFICNGILQAQGDSKSLERALIVAFVANIGLNPLFMFGIPGFWSGLGFVGIAVSTVVSQTGVMIFMIYKALHSPVLDGLAVRHFRPQLDHFSEILVQALPNTFALLVMFLSGFVIQYALKDFGEHAVAGFGIAIRIEQILLLPVLGMTSALMPIASQNFGAEDYDRVRASIYFCWKLGWIIAAIAGPAMWFGGAYAMALFTDDPEVIRVGTAYLRIDGLIFGVYMMLFSMNSILQALKKPIWTLWIGLYRQGFGIAFFVWIFVGLLGFSEIGVWIGIASAVVTGLGVALVVGSRVAKDAIGGLWVRRDPVLAE